MNVLIQNNRCYRGYPDKDKGADVEKMGIYIDYIDELGQNKHYDMVLIYGRFRVSCSLKLLVGGYIDDKSIVLIHDYKNREFYKIVETYYDVVGKYHDESGILGIFKMKNPNNIDQEQLISDYNKYRLDDR